LLSLFIGLGLLWSISDQQFPWTGNKAAMLDKEAPPQPKLMQGVSSVGLPAFPAAGVWFG
jgi:hypothetical protein